MVMPNISGGGKYNLPTIGKIEVTDRGHACRRGEELGTFMQSIIQYEQPLLVADLPPDGISLSE